MSIKQVKSSTRHVHVGINLLLTCHQIKQEARSFLAMNVLGYLVISQLNMTSRRWIGQTSEAERAAISMELGLDVASVPKPIKEQISWNSGAQYSELDDATVMSMLTRFRDINLDIDDFRAGKWPPTVLNNVIEVIKVLSLHSSSVANVAESPRRATIDLDTLFRSCAAIQNQCYDEARDVFEARMLEILNRLIDNMLGDAYTMWEIHWWTIGTPHPAPDSTLISALKKRCRESNGRIVTVATVRRVQICRRR
jgi:hypothetical protein